MAELDVAALQQQLEALKEQQHKAQQKLNDMKAARAKGRGPPGSMGDRGFGGPIRAGAVFTRLGPGAGPRSALVQQRDGPPARTSVFDRLYNSSASVDNSERGGPDNSGPDQTRAVSSSSRDNPHLHRQSSRGEAEAEAAPNSTRQPMHSRLASRVVAPNGPAASVSGDLRDHQVKDPHLASAGAGRKRLLSAVVINGEARTVSSSLDKESAELEPAAKRPTLQTDDRSKRRAQLMLGRMLVGTLQKAKDESEAFRGTAQRRQELERRAAEKAEAAAERLKEQERAARQQERHTQVCQLLDIEMQTKAKELEIKYAKIIQRKQKLLTFCVTKAQPAIYWSPREPSSEMAALLQEHATAFEEWKQQQLQQMEVEKADLAALIASRKEKSAARLAGGPGQRDDEQEQQEDGEHEAEGQAADAGGKDAGLEAEAADEQMADGGRQQVNEAAEDIDHPSDQQYDEQDQQQAVPDDDGEAASAAVEAEPRSSRRRQRDSDDEEDERLLSSEDDDEL